MRTFAPELHRPKPAISPVRTRRGRPQFVRPHCVARTARRLSPGPPREAPSPPAQRADQRVAQLLAEEVHTMLDRAHVTHRDPDRPCFHVGSRSGWINDPNGPIHYGGVYHLFYQHVVNSCEWSFGLVWGHAISRDLVHWEHLPPALLPTPGSGDADGCFSGCAVIDSNGLPTILYTGVRLRSNPDCGPLPPIEQDLQLPFIETQFSATPVEGDDLLRVWKKNEVPLIDLPPADVPLVGWRDPFIFERGGNGREWGMLMGAGLKGQGGSAMIYRSKDLTSGWRYEGMLCEAENADTGLMWECPILLQLNRTPESTRPQRLKGLHGWGGSREALKFLNTNISVSSSSDPLLPQGIEAGLPTTDTLMANPKSMLSLDDPPGSADDFAAAAGSGQYTHFFCVSPDAPTNPVLFWVGRYDAATSRFDLENAKGPYRMDLGDVMYAPNMMTDDRGRHLFWGWLQERRRVGMYDYSGCLSLPRLLYLRGDTLVQEPAPEVTKLRCGEDWHSSDLTVYPESGTPLEGVAGHALEVELTLTRGTSNAAGLHFRSWRADSEHAAVLVDWERAHLEVVFSDGANGDLTELVDLPSPPEDGAAPTPGGAAPFRRVGGPIDLRPGEPLTLRVFVDHSCIEVYCSTGEVLSTRVYRGQPPRASDAGIELVSYGGAAKAVSVRAWEMGTIWKEELAPAAGMMMTAPSIALSNLDSNDSDSGNGGGLASTSEDEEEEQAREEEVARRRRDMAAAVGMGNLSGMPDVGPAMPPDVGPMPDVARLAIEEPTAVSSF